MKPSKSVAIAVAAARAAVAVAPLAADPEGGGREGVPVVGLEVAKAAQAASARTRVPAARRRKRSAPMASRRAPKTAGPSRPARVGQHLDRMVNRVAAAVVAVADVVLPPARARRRRPARFQTPYGPRRPPRVELLVSKVRRLGPMGNPVVAVVAAAAVVVPVHHRTGRQAPTHQVKTASVRPSKHRVARGRHRHP